MTSRKFQSSCWSALLVARISKVAWVFSWSAKAWRSLVVRQSKLVNARCRELSHSLSSPPQRAGKMLDYAL